MCCRWALCDDVHLMDISLNLDCSCQSCPDHRWETLPDHGNRSRRLFSVFFWVENRKIKRWYASENCLRSWDESRTGKIVSRAGPKTRQPKYLSLDSKEGLECTSEIILSVWSGPRLSLAGSVLIWCVLLDPSSCNREFCGVENYRLFSVSFTRRWSRKASYFVRKVTFQFQFHGAEKVLEGRFSKLSRISLNCGVDKENEN